MTRLAVIDHGAGNLVSIAQGLRRSGAEVTIAAHADALDDVDGIVLPGVGTTGAAMKRLHDAGLVDPLRTYAGPLLGICVGLQLFFETSEEDDGRACLGMVGGAVRRLDTAPLLPHIGWNDVAVADDPIFAGLGERPTFYFVHSYAPVPDDDGVVIGRTEYGAPFVAAVRDRNRVGVQFHPERSSRAGLRVLANFVDMCGQAHRAA